MIRSLKLTLWLCLVTARWPVSSSRYTPWSVGKEYVYEMHAVTMTDIPDLASQSAGVKFDAELVIQCRHAGSILVKMIQVTARSFHADVEDAWQLLESGTLGNETVVEGKRHLQEPFTIRHRDGVFQSIIISREDPLWVINMKKAIASKLQVNVVGSKRNSGFRHRGNVANSVYTLFEDGVTGECETLYEIAALSDGLIRSDGKLNPVPELCIDGTFFQVVKTKNYGKCRRNADGSAPAHSRSSVSRYIACGSLERFTLLKQSHQGDWRMHPHGVVRMQQLRGLSIVKFLLKSVTRLVGNTSETAPKTRLWNLERLSASLDVGGRRRGRRFHFEQLRRRVATLLDSCIDATSAHIADTLSMLVHDVGQLDYEEIAVVYEDVRQRRWRPDLQRKLLLDVITAAGSNPAGMFLIDAVIDGNLNESEAIEVISALPLFVKSPTAALLAQSFRMLKAVGTWGVAATVYQTAMRSVSQLAGCVNSSRSGFHDAAAVISELIAHLANVARRHGSVDNQMAALSSLKDVAHEDVVPIVVSLLAEKVEHTILFRVKVVLVLRQLVRNERVVTLLSAVFHDPSEHSQVRMAALALLMMANPPAYWWQKIAVTTWYEPSSEVVAFVYTTLSQLADGSIDVIDAASDKAQIVLQLAKPAPLDDSFAWIWSRSAISAAYGRQLGRFLGPHNFDLFELQLVDECWRKFPSSLISQSNSEMWGAVAGYLNAKKRTVYDLIRDVCNEREEIRCRKWMQLSSAEVAVTNSLGLMVTARTQTHLLVDFIGRFNGDSVDLKMTGLVKSTVTMATDAEFIGYSSMAAVDAQWVVDTPGHFSAAFQGSHLMVSLKPTPSDDHRLVYHHRVRPFTSLQAMNETVAVSESSSVKEIYGKNSFVRTERHSIVTQSGLQLDSVTEKEVVIDDVAGAETFLEVGSITSLRRKWQSVTLNAATSAVEKILFRFDVGRFSMT